MEAFMHDIATGKKTASRQKTKPRGLSVVRGGRGVASRSVGLFGAMFPMLFAWAFDWTPGAWHRPVRR